MDNLLKENEVLEDLELNNLKIIQNKKEFCFGMDAVLLSDFVKVRKGLKAIDLCTGTAIIPILLSAKANFKEIDAIEYNEEVLSMAKRSVFYNKLEDLIKLSHIDVREVKKYFLPSTYDVLTVNPPYMKLGNGFLNKGDSISYARHEIFLKLEELVNSISYLLKENAKLFMVYRPNRLIELISYLNKKRIEVKRLRFVHPFKDKEANLVLVEAVKGGGSFLKVEKPLIVYKEDRTYTDEILKIYGKK